MSDDERRVNLPPMDDLMAMAETMQRKDIAAHLGCSRQSVTRILKEEYKRRGIPYRTRREFPPYATLRRMYMDGMSYQDIAIKIKHDESSLHKHMKRKAIAAGETWPLQRPKRRPMRVDTVKVDLIEFEVKEFCEARGWSLYRFAQEGGMCESWLYEMIGPNPVNRRMRRKSAKKIMNFIIQREQKEAA